MSRSLINRRSPLRSLVGNGLGTVIAAFILAASAVYGINVWLTTKKERSPAKNIEQGIERIKDAAGKAIESRN